MTKLMSSFSSNHPEPTIEEKRKIIRNQFVRSKIKKNSLEFEWCRWLEIWKTLILINETTLTWILFFIFFFFLSNFVFFSSASTTCMRIVSSRTHSYGTKSYIFFSALTKFACFQENLFIKKKKTRRIFRAI